MASLSRPQVVSFSGGEVDDYILARIDLDIHPSTAKTMENVFIVQQGAMELPPGTKFLRATPDNGIARLRPWMFNLENAFCLEFSDQLLRFISGDAYVTLEGAPATVGVFSDESAAVPAGGNPPPMGGGGEGQFPPDSSCVWLEYEGTPGFWYCPNYAVLPP